MYNYIQWKSQLSEGSALLEVGQAAWGQTRGVYAFVTGVTVTRSHVRRGFTTRCKAVTERYFRYLNTAPPPKLITTTLLKIYLGIYLWKKLANRLRFDRIVAMSLWPHFFGPPCIYLLSYHDLYLIICLITSYSIWSHDYVCRPIRSFCSCLSCFYVFSMF